MIPSFISVNPQRKQVLCQRALWFCLPILALVMPFGIALQHCIFALVFLLSCLCLTQCRQWSEVLSQPLFILLMIYVAIILVGVCYTEQISLPQGWDWAMCWKQASFALCLLFMPFFKEASWRIRCMDAFILACIILPAIVLLYQVNAFGLSFEGKRSLYVFSHQIFVSLFMAFAAFLAIIRRHQVTGDRRRQGAYSIAFILITLSLLFQNPSRTGFIVYAVLLMYYAISWLGRLSKKPILVGMIWVVLLSIAFFSVPNIRARFNQVLDDVSVLKRNDASQFYQETSVGKRVWENKEGFYLWRTRPFFGYGTGGYRAIHQQRARQFGWLSVDERHLENTFWIMAVEHGVLGVMVWLALLVLCWRQVKDYPVLERMMARGFLCLILLASFSQDMISADIPRIFYLYFTALLFSQRSPESSDVKEIVGESSRDAVSPYPKVLE
jgi:O-antigen ligase